MDGQRHIVWFSYGAASAVAWLVALRLYENVIAVNCDTSKNEHPDNARFREEMERLTGQRIITIASEKYVDIEDVAEKTRYMAGPDGARCTVELKKVPRYGFQRADDIHIFGYPADEEARYRQFQENNFDVFTANPLLEEGITKDECYGIVKYHGIELPMMYRLGFKNNNCIGCFKATSAAYWNKIRRLFPDVFERRCKQSRDLGVRLTRYKSKRIFLDELPPDYMVDKKITEDLSCGPMCGVSK